MPEAGEGVRPARDLPRAVLWETLAALRRESHRRGELLPPAWVDETVEEIARGDRAGWAVGPASGPLALCLLWTRGRRLLFHLHGGPGPEALEAMSRLVDHVRSTLPAEIQRMDGTATGLGPEEESALGDRLAREQGFFPLLRRSMTIPISLENPPPDRPLPAGYSLATTSRFSLEEVASVDWRAYLGAPDQSLLSDTPEENRALMEAELGGRMGRYLDAASPAAADREGRLAAFIVTAEKSVRSGIFLDIAVDPDHRRRGLGEALLLRGLRGLLALGYLEGLLWVTDSNLPAKALYGKSGFRPRATAVVYRWSRGGTP